MNVAAATGATAVAHRFGYSGPATTKPHGNTEHESMHTAPSAAVPALSGNSMRRNAHMLTGKTTQTNSITAAFVATGTDAPTAPAIIAATQCHVDG